MGSSFSLLHISLCFCCNVLWDLFHIFLRDFLKLFHLCCAEGFFFSLTSLLFPAYVSVSPFSTLLFTAPPQLAPSVHTGVYFLITSLMKVLNKTGWNLTSAHDFLWTDLRGLSGITVHVSLYKLKVLKTMSYAH